MSFHMYSVNTSVLFSANFLLILCWFFSWLAYILLINLWKIINYITNIDPLLVMWFYIFSLYICHSISLKCSNGCSDLYIAITSIKLVFGGGFLNVSFAYLFSEECSCSCRYWKLQLLMELPSYLSKADSRKHILNWRQVGFFSAGFQVRFLMSLNLSGVTDSLAY